MNSYFLDTSVVISFLKGNEVIVQKVKELRGSITSSYIVLAELYEGVYRSRNPEEIETKILNFFKGFDEIFGIDGEIANKFGLIRANLKNRGEIIEDMDIFIAATCISHNLELVTLNPKHFKRIKSLNIVNIIA